MRKLLLGDIHGGHKSLMQCLERAKYKDSDQLILLGDIVDGWPETKQCIDEMIEIKNKVVLIGNHDQWTFEWMLKGYVPQIWYTQGGKETIESYTDGIPDSHIEYFRQAKNYYIDDNRLFVHGGIDWSYPIEEAKQYDLIWDRNLLEAALFSSKDDKNKQFGPYREIYIGHTTTSRFSDIPIKLCNVWCMDQGGGYEGKLSIMDIDTHEFWQSDNVDTLYPDHHGRN